MKIDLHKYIRRLKFANEPYNLDNMKMIKLKWDFPLKKK